MKFDTQKDFDYLYAVPIHLVDDETRSRAICSGLPWQAPEVPPDVKVKFCPACQATALRRPLEVEAKP